MHEKLLLLLLLVLIQNVHSEINEDDCIPIKQCSKAIELLKTKDSQPNNVQLLLSSKCGYFENQPMVKCKMLNRNTPSSSSCIPIKQCNTALKLLKLATSNENIRRLLQFSQCGYADLQPKVNCTYIDKQVITLGKYFDDKDCMHITKCPQAYDHPNILKTAYCGIGEIKVKCSLFPNNTEIKEDPDCVLITKCPQAYDYPDILNNAFCGRNEIKVKCSMFPKNIVKKPISQCGIHDTTSRIFGGNFTSLDEFPWIALIYANYGHKIDHNCHGTVINTKFVLTAAHCVDPDILRANKIKNLDSVVLGEYDTRTERDCLIVAGTQDCADPIKKYEIADVLIHPNFNRYNGFSDIALLKLDKEVIYTDFIKPICLPPKNIRIKEEEKFWVSGWGKTETERRSPVKLKAIVSYVNSDNCVSTLKRNLVKNIICAGRGDGVDTCNGDSGGPLMLEKVAHKNMVIYQIGIVSIGSKCGAGPATYTYVPNYIDWIEHNIKN